MMSFIIKFAISALGFAPLAADVLYGHTVTLFGIGTFILSQWFIVKIAMIEIDREYSKK